MFNLGKIPHVIGCIVILAGVVFCIGITSDFIHDYRHPSDNLKLNKKIDSLSTDILIIKEDRKYLEERVSKYEQMSAERDSTLNEGQKNINYEVKKLRSYNDNLIIAIGDSILRSKGARR